MIGSIGTGIVLVCVIFVTVYLTTIRRTLARLDSMETKTVEFLFAEKGLACKSDLGLAEIPWKQLAKVWRYPDMWLLHGGNRSFFTLPLAQVEDAAQSFILQQIEQHGGKID
jgi:hypothetical protein